MKKLQNNFTTPEQSKRLLEFGVPADSADFRQPKDNGLDGKEYIIFHNMFPFSKEVESTIFDGDNLLPCWSVGRMMEICKICEPKKDYEQLCEELQYSQNYCVVIISHIIANLPIIDFSKLED